MIIDWLLDYVFVVVWLLYFEFDFGYFGCCLYGCFCCMKLILILQDVFIMLKNFVIKYCFFFVIVFVDCIWFNKMIICVLIWMSMDLCDGNQVLFELMNVECKMCMFKMFVQIGFKEIEVVFFVVFQIDFDFVCELIEGGYIFDGVVIEVFMQVCEDLICCMMELLCGVKCVIIYVYNVIVLVFCCMVFNIDCEGVKCIVV